MSRTSGPPKRVICTARMKGTLGDHPITPVCGRPRCLGRASSGPQGSGRGQPPGSRFGRARPSPCPSHRLCELRDTRFPQPLARVAIVIRQDPLDSSRLDACRYVHMMTAMARAATTSDAFNAIAEPQRRDILTLLRAGERPVTDLAQELGMSQPRASKHLRVLREVGLVRVRKAGKQRLYGLDARGLRPVHEWVGGFERYWSESFDRLDEYVRELKQERQEGPPDGDAQ